MRDEVKMTLTNGSVIRWVGPRLSKADRVIGMADTRPLADLRYPKKVLKALWDAMRKNR